MHFIYRQDDTDKEIVNVENLEISKKNIAVVVPSPRKINMEKISRSPIKNKELTPSNIKTPPRRILHARIQGIVFKLKQSLLLKLLAICHVVVVVAAISLNGCLITK